MADDRLLQAVRQSDLAGVRAALRAHADPNAHLPDGSVALTVAVNHQNEAIVRELIAGGAAPNGVGKSATRPITMACELASDSIVKILLGAGASGDASRSDGTSPLMLCARHSNPGVLEQLIHDGAKVNGVNEDGQTALMYAAAAGKVDNMTLLIKRGAKVNQASKNGFTPLFFAVQSDGAAATRTLLSAGADLKYKMIDTTALQIALYEHNFDAARLLIDKGAALNVWDRSGLQPLHLAIQAKDAAFVKYLVAKGADINAPTRQAYWVDTTSYGSKPPAPLKTDDDRPVKIVLRTPQGAGAQGPAPPAMPPLLLAASTGSVDMMHLLVDAGAKTDAKSEDGSNLLFVAAKGGDLNAVRYALQLAPDPAVLTELGQTVMHAAIQGARSKDAVAIIKLLADSGAPLNDKDKKGQSPVDLLGRAPDNVKKAYAEILQAHGIVATIPSGRRGQQ